MNISKSKFFTKFLTLTLLMTIFINQVRGDDDIPDDPLGTSEAAKALPKCDTGAKIYARNGCGGKVCKLLKCTGCSKDDNILLTGCDKNKDYQGAITQMNCGYVNSTAALEDDGLKASKSKLVGSCKKNKPSSSENRLSYIHCAKICKKFKDPEDSSAEMRPYICNTVYGTFCQCINVEEGKYSETNPCPRKPDPVPKPKIPIYEKNTLNKLLHHLIQVIFEMFEAINTLELD